MKLLPKYLRETLKIRRVCRKKINERIIAIQDVISSLQTSKDHLFSNHTMSKAVDKLNKVLSEADIRLLMESLAQKNDSEMAEKDAKKKGTNLIKELEKNKREAEKEKKRMDRELQKEKLQSEKEKKRLQEEAERDEKRREKEVSERRKQLKRKQEEADKEQRRKEKEEAELKKQLSVKKQASIMERFLQKSRIALALHKDQAVGIVTSDADVDRREPTFESVSQLMDSALQHVNDIDVDEIRKSHMNSWHLLGHSIRSNNQHWGMRQKPKTQLFKELKLTTNGGPARDDDLCIDSIVDEWVETNPDGKSCHNNTSISSHITNKCFRRKQLLQFDKSNRPAFYGIWPKKSCVIGSRHPFTKDPDLDYEIDSDEEWEEEEPGESLSDSEKEEEENLDEVSCNGDDEEESEDGFFVPDGYLSENEGVEIDKSQSEAGDAITYSSPSRKPEAESEEWSAWTRQRKYLNNLTEHALKKNQPLVITNLMHEKTDLLLAKDLSDTLKVEQMCLQALSMRGFPGRLSIEVPTNVNLQEENQETSTSNSKGSEVVATGIATVIQDSDLPKIVSVIQSCPQGINKVLESLLQRFPDVPKSHLRNKVREIADFVHNRWQVKKEILDKLGLTTTPEKSGKRTKGIATFFSKRCLPPTGKATNLCESSPESMKTGSSSQQQPLDSTKNV
ncbi:chromatin assembly factor 1 subunit FAS1-like isoform X2 [Silene latifolia]